MQKTRPLEELQSEADSTRDHAVSMKLHQNLGTAFSQTTSPGSVFPFAHPSISVSWLQAQEESWQRTVRLR